MATLKSFSEGHLSLLHVPIMDMMMMKMTHHLPAEVEVESSFQDYNIIMFLCVSHDDFIHDDVMGQDCRL